MEIELKLAINSADARALRANPLLLHYQSTPPHDQRTNSVYFDTPELEIWEHDAGLRVRLANGLWVQTFKGGGDVAGGLHRRNEWESKLSEPLPDLKALRQIIPPNTRWGKLVRRKHLARRLMPLFFTDVVRTVWQLRLDDGVQIECVLDLGTVRCDKLEEPISEIELELKAGAPADLFEFARRLQQSVGLRPVNLSKAARGYALFAPDLATRAAPRSLSLAPHSSVEEGFQQIALHCLDAIQSNEARVITGDDVESVHRMRVGLRRLRCALRFFEKLIVLPVTLQTEWDWLATQLSAARDWDVLLDTTLPRLRDRVPDVIPIDTLRAAAQQCAVNAHQQAAAAVASARYCTLQLLFMQWLHGCGWRATGSIEASRKHALEKPISEFAQQVQQHYERRLRQQGKKIAKGDTDALHRIRIAAKHTRYAAEFFQSLYPKRRVQRSVAALTALQEALGVGNDAAVAGQLLIELDRQPKRGHDVHAGINFLRGHLHAEQHRGIKAVRRLFAAWRLHRLS